MFQHARIIIFDFEIGRVCKILSLLYQNFILLADINFHKLTNNLQIIIVFAFLMP